MFTKQELEEQAGLGEHNISFTLDEIQVMYQVTNYANFHGFQEIYDNLVEWLMDELDWDRKRVDITINSVFTKLDNIMKEY